MFIGGHINESVRKALERFEKTVQDLTSTHNKQGSELMALAFDERNPKIKFSTLSNPQEVNKQVGIQIHGDGFNALVEE